MAYATTLRERVEDGQVVLKYCSTKDMKADMMTKPIPAIQFEHLRRMPGVLAPSVESSGSVGEDTSRPRQDNTGMYR